MIQKKIQLNYNRIVINIYFSVTDLIANIIKLIGVYVMSCCKKLLNYCDIIILLNYNLHKYLKTILTFIIFEIIVYIY